MLKRLFVFFVLILFFCVTAFYDDECFLDAIKNCNYVLIGGGQYKIYNSDYRNIIKSLNIEVIEEGCISDRIIIEGYLSSIDNYVVLNGRKVNVQMSVCDNNIILGVPLINGSF